MVSLSPLRPLAAGGGRPTLRNLRAQAEVYVHLAKRAQSLRQQLFGYAKGMPGENSWLRPLKGKELKEYYWPSKYDLPSFHLEQYFAMQALRYAPKKTHPALVSLSRLLVLMGERRDQVRSLLSQLDGDLLREHPTLQDLYALYRSLFSDDPLKGVAPEKKFWRWADHLNPQTLLALLEQSATLKGEDSKFFEILQEAKRCRSFSELEETLRQRVGDELSPALLHSLLYLATREALVLPAPACSPKATPHRVSEAEETTARLQEKEILREIEGGEEEGEKGAGEGRDRFVFRVRLLAACREAAKQQQQVASAVSAASGFTSTIESSELGEDGRRAGLAIKKGRISRRKEIQSLDPLSLGLLEAPAVYVHPIQLLPPETETEKTKREATQEQAMNALQRELERDPQLKAYLYTRHRFLDPLFKRRRLSLLDRLARGKIKSQTERELGAQLYIHHPDKLPSFPTNKGLRTRKWPSPYH